jgi:hypothetical protein
MLAAPATGCRSERFRGAGSVAFELSPLVAFKTNRKADPSTKMFRRLCAATFNASHHVHPLELPMNKQPILAGLLAAVFVALPGAFAQKTNGSTKPVVSHADAHLANLSTKLTLTPDEKGKIKPILDSESARIDALKMDKSLSDVNRKAKIKPIRDDSDKQIRAVLTPAQQKIYDAMSKKAESGGTKKAGGKKKAAA